MDDRVYSPADLLDSIRIAKVSLDRGKPIIGVRQLSPPAPVRRILSLLLEMILLFALLFAS